MCRGLAFRGFGFAGWADEAAEVRHGVDQPFVAQLTDRLADGVAGNAELLDEADFRDEVLWRVFAAADASTEHVGDLLPAGAIRLEFDHEAQA